MRPFRLKRAEGFRVPCLAHGTGDGMPGPQRAEGESAAEPGADAGDEEDPAGMFGQIGSSSKGCNGNGHASSVEASQAAGLRVK